MTICLESYIGEAGGAEGVKLEEQVLVTETGCEALSRYPFEDAAYSAECRSLVGDLDAGFGGQEPRCAQNGHRVWCGMRIIAPAHAPGFRPVACRALR